MKIGHFLSRQFCVISIISVVRSDAFMDATLIHAFFEEKQISHATFVGCFDDTREKINFTKQFISQHRAISVLNIDKLTRTKFLGTQSNRMGVVLDGDCDVGKISDFLRKCGIKKYFDVKHHWLILSSNESFSEIFRNVEIYINADIQIVHSPDRVFPGNFTVEDVYNPAYGKGGELKNKTIGYYSEKYGFTARETQCRYWSRRNMTGVTLKSQIVLPIPFEGTLQEYLESETNREINTFNRFHHSVMCSCEKYYNFTSHVTLSNSWGYLSENGTWDGVVAALDEKRIDYGSSPLFVRPDRAEVMEYGRRTWTLRAAFVFRNPRAPTTADVFFKPLSFATWITTIFAVAFLIVSLRLTQMYEKKTVNEHADVSWSYFVICTFASFCQQGMTTTPSFYSGRIIILSLLILSLMIYQFYSASLVSTLLMKPETKIKSIGDILESDMKAGCEDTLYNRDYFTFTTDRLSKELYSKKISGQQKNASNFLTPDEGLALVESGGYAFHVELATAYPIIEKTFPDKSVCHLREVQMYRTQPMHANVQKLSPFRDMFDTCLQRLAEHGILHRELRFWHPKKPECIQTGSVAVDIGLDYFYPSLMFLAIGMLLSVLILALEVHDNLKSTNGKKSFVRVYPFLD